MRAQISIVLLSGSVALAGLSHGAFAQAPDSPAAAALRFFQALPLGDLDAVLRAVRPPHISPDERARVVATLPQEGELIPNPAEQARLAALEPVLIYHERHRVFGIKVIDVPQAVVGMHQRAVLLVSRPALRILSAAELRALVAHEIGHEYFWSEYEDSRLARSAAGRKTLELKCDGVAALTLLALGLDLSSLNDGLRKLTKFNAALGAMADAARYPSLRERQRFVRTLLKTRTRSGS